MTVFLLIAYLVGFLTTDLLRGRRKPTVGRGMVYCCLMLAAGMFCYASFRQWALPNPIEQLSEWLYPS